MQITTPFFVCFFPLNLGSLCITDKHQNPRFKSVTESIPEKRGKATNLSSVIKFHNLSFFWYFCTIIHSDWNTAPDLRLLILLCVHGCGLYFISKDCRVELAMLRSLTLQVLESGSPWFEAGYFWVWSGGSQLKTWTASFPGWSFSAGIVVSRAGGPFEQSSRVTSWVRLVGWERGIFICPSCQFS